MAVLIVGGACAVFLYGRFDRDRPEPVRRPDAGIVSTTTPGFFANPAKMVSEPLAGTGFEKLQICADDVFAPPGAVRRSALRRKAPSGTEDIVAYVIKANISDVEKFYSDRLTKAGYKSTQKRATMQPGGVLLVFLRDLQRYCVTLRYADKEKGIVKIVLVIFRPGQ